MHNIPIKTWWLYIFLVLITYRAAFPKTDDNCISYFPMQEGVELEMKQYNARNKVKSITKHRVIKKTLLNGASKVVVKQEIYNAKGKYIDAYNYEMICEKNLFQIDMRSLVELEQTKSFANMRVNINASFLEMPYDMNIGDTLAGGILTFTITNADNTQIDAMNISISNRVVEGFENVNTSAGTFECVKLSYITETEISMVKNYEKVIAWYSKDIGLVKLEEYSKNNKLKSYKALSKILQ